MNAILRDKDSISLLNCYCWSPQFIRELLIRLSTIFQWCL